MPTNESSADASSTTAKVTRRALAVARVVDPARERAETRVQSFLDAALELMNNSGKEFTVQEVVERSGQSLRSFYQYFDGKYELLLALFEDSVRSTANYLREQIADEERPLDRLHRFAVEYHRLCRPAPKGRAAKKGRPTLAMGEFAQQLLAEHPEEASQSFVPLVTVLEELLDDGASAGVFRAGLPHRAIAGVLLQAIMFSSFAGTISGSSSRSTRGDAAEEMWELFLRGLTTGASA